MRVSNERTDWLARHVFPHERAIRGWLRHRLALGLEIDDVVHEMYAKLIALPAVEQIESPRRYAFRVAYGIVVDHVRRSKVVRMEEISDPQQLKIASADPSIEEQLVRRDELRDLQSVLSTLPPLCRQAFLLRRVDGLSQRETAAKLGVSEKTIEKYMTRALRLVMDVYGRGGKPKSRSSSRDEEPEARHERRRR